MASRMYIEPNAEIFRLRTALRDLVAVSTIPVAWLGREPSDIAAGVADVLSGSLCLDFAFVRLCDPAGGVAVELTRGNAWKAFPEWLQRHLATVGKLSRKEIIPEVGDGAERCRGLVVPIGVNAEGGLVAAACGRPDFPSEVDQMLLSMAANHAATAFQSARVEQGLRRARSELETKVAERTVELRRATGELQTILDASPVGIALFGRDQVVQRCNPAFERIVGWRADQIAGRRVSVLKTSQDQAFVLPEKPHADEAFARVETRLVRKDGSEFEAAVSCAPLQDEAGSPAGFVGTIEDVSERKRADDDRERLLRNERRALAEAMAAQQRFRDLVNSVEGIVWEADAPTFQFAFVSNQAERILGYPVERWLSEPTFWTDHLHPNDREWAVRFCEEAVGDKRDHDFEYRMIAADGRVVWVRDLVTVVVQGDRATRLRGVMVDITERKRAEEERHAHLWFFESMDRINRAIQGTNVLEQMMSDVLDEVLSIFDCDRAWLFHPCDPEAESWQVPMERTRPEFPGVLALGREMPMHSDVVELFRAMKASSAPVQFGPGSENPLPAGVAKRFSIQSQISMAVHPKADEPYVFGLHQCSHPRVWTPQEERLFQEIGRRLADAVTSLLMLRNLRESEARLEEAQRIAHVGHWERHLEVDRIDWSDETYRIFGLAPQERTIDFDGLQHLIHPEDRQMMLGAVAQTLQGDPRYDVEYRVVRPNGEERIVRSQGVVRRNESGPPPRMFGTIQDITEQKRAEAEVRESERRYRYIFQSTGVSIWEQDFSQVKDAIDDLKAKGVQDFRQYLATHPAFVQQAISMVKIIDVNAATVKLFEAQSKDELLVSLHKIFLPEAEEMFAGELIAIAEGGTNFESETVLQTLNGDKLTVLFTMTFPRQPAKLNSVLVSIMDITERKRTEEELRKAQAELAHVTRVMTMGELAASIAHEVNQPIAAIVTNGNACLRWLTGNSPNLDEAREAARRIIRDGNRAGDVIGRIRTLLRKTGTEKELLDMNQVIREIVALAEGEVRRSGVALRTELAGDLPPILGDRVELEQVVLNLIVNAIEAMSAIADRPRELVIRTQSGEVDQVRVTVQDSGIGLDPQSMGRFFDAFYTTKSQGMGMGLAISRSIVENHGGRLWAVPNDGPGATFQFTLMKYG